MKINCGILAFQGNVEEHHSALERLNLESKRVISSKDLNEVTHLIMPGGESTVISAFLKETGLGKLIQERAQNKTLFILGTCAGAILASKKVSPPEKVLNLNLIDAEIDRNAYGSQLHSFEVDVDFLPTNESITATFIRAPQFTKIGKDVEVLAKHEGNPILIQKENIMAATFHPEYLEEPVVHRYFLDKL